MSRFSIGDKVKHPAMDGWYEVIEVDEITQILPQYKVKDNFKTFWDYCVNWIKFVSPDDSLRYGNILTDDINFGMPKGICTDYVRIRTISYDNRIFYHKMVNGEVVEFKELTV